MAEQNKIIEHRISDWAMRPGPRFREQGPKSGEEFYCDRLKGWFDEAVAQNAALVVVLDGTDGYLTSFIDESFGRLVYEYGRDRVEKVLTVISTTEPEWLKRLNDKTFPLWEQRRKDNDAPRMTKPID